MMRQGKLLAEEQPKALMSRFNSSNLETIFLRWDRLFSELQLHATDSLQAVCAGRENRDYEPPRV